MWTWQQNWVSLFIEGSRVFSRCTKCTCIENELLSVDKNQITDTPKSNSIPSLLLIPVVSLHQQPQHQPVLKSKVITELEYMLLFPSCNTAYQSHNIYTVAWIISAQIDKLIMSQELAQCTYLAGVQEIQWSADLNGENKS